MCSLRQHHPMRQADSSMHQRSAQTCRETVASGYVTPRNSARGPSRASVCRQQASTPEKPCPGCSAGQSPFDIPAAFHPPTLSARGMRGTHLMVLR